MTGMPIGKRRIERNQLRYPLKQSDDPFFFIKIFNIKFLYHLSGQSAFMYVGRILLIILLLNYYYYYHYSMS